MIEGLKPYREYKESGSPWLGRFPSHWQLPRLGSILSERGETNEARQMGQVLSVMRDIGVVPYEEKGRVGNKKSEDTARYKIVRPDDIVVNCMNVIIGSVGLSRYTGCLSPVYYVLTRRSDNDNPRYLNAVFLTKPFQLSLVRIGNGILAHRMRIPMELLKCEPFPKPPLDEQDAIVRFLDHANGRIERAIQGKKKLIALLGEQKQAIIHRSVTRGLDATVPLKPSGVPWLGDIPQHWTLKRFKFLAVINARQIDPRKKPYRSLVLVAPNHIRSGTGELLKEETAADQRADSGKYLVKKGQIIYSKIRPNLRKAVIAPRDCLCSADMYPISPKVDEVSSSYILQLLLSLPFTKYVVDCSMRVAMPKVNREALADCWLWFPKLEEQNKILDVIARDSLPLDTAIKRTEGEIGLLREYRTRLIADVVTGQLDVREAVRDLPAAQEETPTVLEDEEVEEEAVA